MLTKNLNKLTEESKRSVGLVSLTFIIFLIFYLSNIIFYQEYIPEVQIVEVEGEDANTYDDLLNSIFKKKLNIYESEDGYLLNTEEYKIICKNTKIVAQRAVMGANITNFKAQLIYNASENSIQETYVKWDNASNQCLVGYILKGNINNEVVTLEVTGQAQSFLNTGVDTRVYFIKNF